LATAGQVRPAVVVVGLDSIARSTTPEAEVDPARLRNIPVFSDLDDEEIAHVAALAAEVSVPEGEELVREGDYSYDVLAIEEGTASVERHGEHIAALGPGDVVGEMGVLERSQRNATVRATSPMLLVTLTGWDIRRLRKSAPNAVDHLRGVVAQRREHA
jgi:CRP/FNR family transcriptional regulator, cyclic AMP receptor protein